MSENVEPTRPPIQNLRLRIYGSQGSGSTFPALAERRAYQKWSDEELLDRLFKDLQGRVDAKTGRLDKTIEQIIGGPLDRRTLAQYRDTLGVTPAPVFGGWTTCLSIETADGYDIVLDCGSGFRNCARELQTKWADRPARDLYIFGSHSHLDHTEGFEQAAICFDRRNSIHIYGNRQFLRALDQNLGIFTRHVAEELKGVQTPIFYAFMPATFDATEIRPPDADVAPDALSQNVHEMSRPIRIGKTSILPFAVYHPAPCLAYRIEHGDKAFVFCTDHELRHGPDDNHPGQRASLEAEERVRHHSTGVDLLYRDGQYLRAEYSGQQGIGAAGPTPRLDWGHSCIEDVVDMAEQCRVKRTLIGHHDPNREWSERNWLNENLQRSTANRDAKVELARSETVIDL